MHAFVYFGHMEMQTHMQEHTFFFCNHCLITKIYFENAEKYFFFIEWSFLM